MKSIYSVLIIALIAISCKKDSNAGRAPVIFSNVLILGNSITYSPANPSIDWNGNWGMAATAADSDYVHLLTAKFQQLNSSCKVTAVDILPFEPDFATYNLDSAFMAYRSTNPDLVIIRIGEDVPAGFDAALFDTRYAALVNYFKATDPNVHVFAAGSFWAGKDAVDAIMKKYSPFVSLSYLSSDPTNESYGLYTNAAVETHPSNKAMKAMSDVIWAALQSSN